MILKCFFEIKYCSKNAIDNDDYYKNNQKTFELKRNVNNFEMLHNNKNISKLISIIIILHVIFDYNMNISWKIVCGWVGFSYNRTTFFFFNNY